MTTETLVRPFRSEEEAYATATHLTAALLNRLDVPADADAAADYAVTLFWRVVRRLAMPEPEMARPAQPEFVVQEKQQP
jgi:hypothetical protein